MDIPGIGAIIYQELIDTSHVDLWIPLMLTCGSLHSLAPCTGIGSSESGATSLALTRALICASMRCRLCQMECAERLALYRWRLPIIVDEFH